MGGDDITFDFAPFRKKCRYVVTKKGYVIDRQIFRVYCVVLMSFALIVFAADLLHGNEIKAYASCPVDAVGGKCSNPLFNRCDLPACQKETLLPGETIGTPYDNVIERFTLAALFFLLVVFLINHILQNTQRYVNERNKNSERF